MGIPGAANPLLLASAASNYQIERSLRFNSVDSAYLSRTPASAGDRKTWTWAGWVKRSSTSSSGVLFGARATGGWDFQLWFDSTGEIEYDVTPVNQSRIILGSTALFRDPSAWLHVTLSVNTNAATASQRIRIYINGLEVALDVYQIGSGYVPQYSDLGVNAASTAHYIGGRVPDSDRYFSGYLADIHFIDGQALTPTSFGETDANGIWQPKAYTGTYGTNGFRLDFSDNSAATATTLGKDRAGSNNWTPNNLSVTAGAGNDSLVDTPTNYGTDTGVGGEVRGNYCTWNPLNIAGGVLANGNLDLTNTGGGRKVGTVAVSSGKWYWEVTVMSAGDAMIGIMPPSNPAPTGSNNYLGGVANEYGYYGPNGQKYNNASAASYGAAYTNGDVIGIALDMDAGTLIFYKNNTSQGTAFSGLSGTFAPAASSGGSSGASMTANFGQRPFAYAAPSGFKALCTANIPEGTITTSGTFTGNANADGPFVYLNGVPTAMTINGNAVTFATHADKLSNGFKVRSSSSSYNTSGSNTYSVTTTGAKFKVARAQPNP